MASSPSFDHLVTELSAEERELLLERIKASMPVSTEPLYPAQSAPMALPVAQAEDIGLVSRLLLFLRCLFSGKSKGELLREDELRAIARRIEGRAVGIIDRKRSLILGVVAEELRGLRDSARFFYDALDRSVERDKGAFIAFLASIELPDTHERLVTEADPESIATSISELRGGPPGDQELRQAAFSAYDSVFSELSEKGRRAMYQDLRSVLFLKRLSGFLFDRLIGAFKESMGPDAPPAAAFFDVRELLLDLGDILFSMSEPPSTALVEAIFVFAERGALGKGEEAATVLGEDMAQAEAALGRIRSFNSRVPLGDLLKLISGDPGYLPRELPGGEDWLAAYKAFWRERIDLSLSEWRSEHRNKELVEEIAAFVGEPGPQRFTYISREEREDVPPVRLDLALIFLDAFYRGPFLREINRPLKIVLIDGEFYRKDNRVEFTDAYDALLRIPEAIAALDAKLGPEGEMGSAWLSTRSEIGSAPSKRRKLQTIARGADEEAELIIRRVGIALRTMTSILKGFLKGEAGGRYDSLSNLSYIDGKANKEFLRNLDRAKDRCERAYTFLSELSGLDLSRDE